MIKKIIFVIGIWFLYTGCSNDIVRRLTPDQQRAIDLEIIEQYFLENNLGTPDTTESGARWVILETGFKDTIEYNKIVGVDYIGYATNGNVFETSIREVADTAFVEVFESVLVPQYFTYSETGWTMRDVRLTNQFAGGAFPGEGLGEAITDAFIKMRLGGKLLVVLPSDQGFESGQSSHFGANAVLVYEIFPIVIL